MTRNERALTAIGLATWLASGIPNLLFVLSPKGVNAPWAVPWLSAFLLFGVCFWILTRSRDGTLIPLIAGSGIALVGVLFGRSGFDPILLVIIAAVAGGRLRHGGIATLITVQTVLLATIEVMRFGTRALPSVGAYAGFMVFGAITAMIAENEKRAREDLAKANAELQMALALLELWSIIRRLRAEGISFLVTTHDLGEAERMCDRVGILHGGRMVAEGTLGELQRIVPAARLAEIESIEAEAVRRRCSELGWQVRDYSGRMTLWLPERLEIAGVIDRLSGLPLDSIAMREVGLEHVWVEVTRERFLDGDLSDWAGSEIGTEAVALLGG